MLQFQGTARRTITVPVKLSTYRDENGGCLQIEVPDSDPIHIRMEDGKLIELAQAIENVAEGPRYGAPRDT